MYGFSLVKKEHIDEISSEVFLYKHTCGARLVFAQNDDENRVIMPVFKTLPENDKGTAHIVEHCTLCGSESYRLKDPFNVLEKGSIYTYLNAITYEDKTVYPVASTDEEELKKMTEVYADALFKPLLTENEGIFQQEGVYRDENGISGVVLNEMKGAFASESKKLLHSLRSVLYKNCNYRYYSGGIPDKIPELTYNEFKRFYTDRYTGANCVIYVYGKVDIEYYMKLFARYFKSAKECDIDESVRVNNTDEPVAVKAGNTAVGMCGALFACASVDNYLECILLSVLCEVLIAGDNSILRQTLVDSGIAIKIGGGYDDSAKATKLYIYAEGADFCKFKNSLQNTFKELVEYGIPQDKISAAINRLKFYIKEKDFGYKPTGLFFGLELMKGLLYGNNSFEPLKISGMLDAAKSADYSALIKKYLLNKGVYGYTVNENPKMDKINMPINYKPLKSFQSQTDSREMLDRVPPKSLKSIVPKPIWFDYDFDSGCLFTLDNKSEIVYLDLVYPLEFDVINISFASLYCNIALYMDTWLLEQAEFYFGKFYAKADIIDKDGLVIPVISLKTSFLRENTNKCIQIIKAFTGGIRFNDNKKVSRLISGEKAIMQENFSTSGNRYAIIRALAAVSPSFALKDKLSGVNMYNLLCSDMCFGRELHKISHYIRNTKPLAVLRGNSSDRRVVCNSFNLTNTVPKAHTVNTKPVNSGGFITGDSVSNSALALKLPFYNGTMELVSVIAERSYIWDKIRLEGGAYGGGCAFLRNGTMYMYSYRDPRVKETIELFKNIGKYLYELNLTSIEFERFKIGAVSKVLKPVKSKTVNAVVLTQLLLERTYENELEFAKQRFNCTLADIKEVGLMLADNMQNAKAVSFGGDAVKRYYGDDNCTKLI